MITTIKADIRKLLTVRSTYILGGIVLLLAAFVSLYVEGYWGKSGSAAGSLTATALQEVTGIGVGIAALFISIIAALQVGHEYRHNFIMYTLTTNARRTQVFLSKAIVLAVFGALFGLFVAGFSVLAYYIGLGLRDASLPPQEINLSVQLFRIAVYSAVYSMVGFIFCMLARNIIGAIAALLVFPTTAEPLLGMLLRDNSRYLPFTAFDHILGNAIMQNGMNPNRAMVVSLLYIGGLGLVTWLLFLRRDAN